MGLFGDSHMKVPKGLTEAEKIVYGPTRALTEEEAKRLERHLIEFDSYLRREIEPCLPHDALIHQCFTQLIDANNELLYEARKRPTAKTYLHRLLIIVAARADLLFHTTGHEHPDKIKQLQNLQSKNW
jgi:hypothetical protein